MEWRSKESFLKVGGPFLPINSPFLVTCTRFLACPFSKVRSTSALKIFYHPAYICVIINHLLRDKSYPWLALKCTPKYNSWGLNGTKHWRFFIVEYRINWRTSQNSILYIKFPGLFRWKAIYEDAYKSLHKNTDNCWNHF